MGTSFALVGAYVLAGELAEAAGDYRAAFASYEGETREYVKEGQKFAKGSAIALIPRSRLQIWLRNQAWRMLPYLPWRDRVVAGANRAASAITLKDYRTDVRGASGAHRRATPAPPGSTRQART